MWSIGELFPAVPLRCAHTHVLLCMVVGERFRWCSVIALGFRNAYVFHKYLKTIVDFVKAYDWPGHNSTASASPRSFTKQISVT